MKIKVIEGKQKTALKIHPGQLWKHKDGMVCILVQVETIVNEEYVDRYALVDLADGIAYGSLEEHIEEVLPINNEYFTLVKQSKLKVKM
jgi:hypothetical protein